VGHAGVVDLDGATAALQFFTGFLIEKSLSLDNIFVIALIFAHFRIPLAYQHRVLFWGILGALVLRGIMIAAGAALVQRFDWMVYVFGGALLFTAVRMLLAGHETLEPDKSTVLRLARRFHPVTTTLHGRHFFVIEDGRRTMTPLFLVLLLVESTDVLFAVDSIPAIFAVTTDPFLVFTSNVFAILGLRSLYFALAPLLDRFRYLKPSLVFILAFVGVKMILSHHWPIPTPASLAVIAGFLGVGIAASALSTQREAAHAGSPFDGEFAGLSSVSISAVRKILALAIGSTLLALGAALLLLPGPGIATLVAGLVILASEFLWARRVLARLRAEASAVMSRLRGGGHDPGPDDRADPRGPGDS
jgi:tellurite resistance protein TerC